MSGGNTWVRGVSQLGGEDVIQPSLRVTLVNAGSIKQAASSAFGQLHASGFDEVGAPVSVAHLPGQREEFFVEKGAQLVMPPASVHAQEMDTGSIEKPTLSRDKGIPMDGEKPVLEGYRPREQLSSPPIPLQEIHIPWPQGLPVLGKQSAIFTVFIDETGTVREMVPDGPTLAPIMVESARQAFMSTRFRPAQAGGMPVKAMLRIEVVFELEATPATSTMPNKPGTIVEQRLL